MKEKLKALDEYSIISAIIGIVFTIFTLFEMHLDFKEWYNITAIIFTAPFTYFFVYYISKAIFVYSKDHLVFKGFAIGFISCLIILLWYTKFNVYKIGEDQEEITATIDRYINIDGHDYLLEDYIKSNNNYLDLESFVENTIWDKIDNEEMCKIGSKLILINDKYYYVCDEGFEKLYMPDEKKEIIEIK